MMYPSLRGGNENPGYVETVYGEVDDVIAATKWLKTLDYVDTDRVYLGGHSTGGTLALLVAAACDEYRGVIAFGPIDDVRGYGPDSLAFDFDDLDEATMRAPICWLHCIKNPTYVIEGAEGRSNVDCLKTMEEASENPLIKFVPVERHDHFSTLAPLNRVIAKQLVNDTRKSFELDLQVE
ncbi:alpha/beta hydrolase family protein [Aeoliella mucimassa]|uniref:alpha/beta hydrolase family protein n=1 Tax=Aeoliella mucimassa TaxID=2527972 RepID=UPI0018D395D1|nr:prolyl oligopeptidase family serine peptidase [Aeoliella mucimassa]